jgi:acetyltransferase-like isoleucine patch superfamily enzyme
VDSVLQTSGPLALGAYRSAVRLRDKLFSLLVSGAFRSFGRNSVLQLPIRLHGEGQIEIGDDVFVGAGSWLQVLEPDGGETRIVVGDGTSIAGSCVLSAAVSVTLGPRVLLARNVYVADHRHAFADSGRAVLDQGIEEVAPVVVEEGAWLGQNVVVGPGVTIGRGAVVGANSVVLDDVPARSVAVGAPARVVRTL